MVGLGCFWGAERLFWKLDGVYTTAVGYAGGYTPNPTYEEVCSGSTGHTEAVLVVFDPAKISLDEILRTFWEGHDPTQGMRQGNDVGTQYRSAIYYGSDEQRAADRGVARALPGVAERRRARRDHDRDRARRARSTTPRTTTSSTSTRTRTATAAWAAPASPARSGSARGRSRPLPDLRCSAERADSRSPGVQVIRRRRLLAVSRRRTSPDRYSRQVVKLDMYGPIERITPSDVA